MCVLHKIRPLKTAAFNTQFLQSKNQLYVYVLGMIKQEDAAKDIIQELYLKLYRSRKQIKDENARFYFFRSAKNICLDWFRNNSGNKMIEFTFEHDIASKEKHDKKELHQHFRNLIKTLPNNHKEVIYLKDVCGMPTQEVVEITGLRTNNIRVMLSRARTEVKKGLAKIYTYEAIQKS